MLTLFIASCYQGWKMDYGEVEAQFAQEGLAIKGKEFVGKKVTVRGTVARIDLRDPKVAWLELENGIRCHLGEFRQMAASARVGEIVFVDGFLQRCDEGDILMKPAMLRDPSAPFTPQ